MRFQNWDEFMAEQRRTGVLGRISDFVTAERRAHEQATVKSRHGAEIFVPPAIHPASDDVFKFTTTPLRDVKVVILGQDPYHQPGQAHGLAFSVQQGCAHPPSLRNILKELYLDLNTGYIAGYHAFANLVSGDLTPWTRQGVLLLNTALTVRQGEPGSHLDIWQPFTDEVVRAVVDSADVAPHFILWGSKAKQTFERCCGQRHTWLSDNTDRTVSGVSCTFSSHPSPLSANKGFFGSRPFSRANQALRLNNSGPDCQIDWRLS